MIRLTALALLLFATSAQAGWIWYLAPTPVKSAADALDEVNAVRARRGLRPFTTDAGLTTAAKACAIYRAQNRIPGHVTGGMGDFQFLPKGTSATSAGCAAWPPHMGWGACCTFDNYTCAGAAVALGSDGQRYMQIFVR